MSSAILFLSGAFFFATLWGSAHRRTQHGWRAAVISIFVTVTLAGLGAGGLVWGGGGVRLDAWAIAFLAGGVVYSIAVPLSVAWERWRNKS